MPFQLTWPRGRSMNPLQSCNNLFHTMSKKKCSFRQQAGNPRKWLTGPRMRNIVLHKLRGGFTRLRELNTPGKASRQMLAQLQMCDSICDSL